MNEEELMLISLYGFFLDGKELLDQNKYLLAFKLFEKSLNSLMELHPQSHDYIGICYFFIGVSKTMIGEVSSPTFRKSVEHLRLYHEMFDRSLVGTCSLGAECVLRKLKNISGVVYNFFLECFKILKLLDLNEVRSNHMEYFELFFYFFDHVGFSRVMEYHETELKTVLKITRLFLDEDDTGFAVCCCKIGKIYFNLDDFEKATELYEKSLKNLLQSPPPENDLILINLYHQLALSYFGVKKYSKCMENLKKCLEMKEKKLHQNHEDIISSYKDLGCLYEFGFFELKKALEYYQKGLPRLQLHVERVKEKISHPSRIIPLSRIDEKMR